MAKPLAAALGLIGTATVAAPVTFLAVNSGGEGEAGNVENDTQIVSDVEVKPISRPKWNGTKITTLAKSEDVKSEYKNIDCLKNYFKGREKWENNSSQNATDPRFTFINRSGYNPRGCLVVEHYKQEHQGKWWGEFKLIWSLSNTGDEEGFVTVFNAKTEDGKLKVDSSIYIVNKSGDDDKKILSASVQENINKDIADSDSLSKYFPQTGTSFKEGNDNYWGFNPDPTKICRNDECNEEAFKKNPNVKTIKWNWQHKDNEEKLATDWNSNFDTWFDNLFDTKWNKIKEDLKKLKGTWTKKS